MQKKYDNEVPCWFAMSAIFGRSIKAKEKLDACGVENFVPMQWKVVVGSDGRKIKKYLPAISNLIFVHTCWNRLLEIKLAMPWLQMQTFPSEGRNVPIVVPDSQMLNFIAAVAHPETKIEYLEPGDFKIEKGMCVRIIGGVLDNVVGVIVCTRGRGKKKLVVEIPGLIAARIEVENLDLIEVL